MPSTMMLQTDTSTASYWITNPDNIVTDNVAAGGEFYGFWYEIKPHPDGAHETSDICPNGVPLGQFKNNVAHSNKRFGLRIFLYNPREYPCEPVNEVSTDPMIRNEAQEALFEDFITYKNEEVGVLAERNAVSYTHLTLPTICSV